MKVTVFGSGYVGLVTGACLAQVGNDVLCVDIDPRKIEMLNKGESPIYEPGLQSLMARNVEQGRLTFTGDLAEAVAGAEAAFIAVGTPTRRGDGHADLTSHDTFTEGPPHNTFARLRRDDPLNWTRSVDNADMERKNENPRTGTWAMK